MAPKNQPLTPPAAGWPLQVRRISDAISVDGGVVDTCD